MWHHSSNLKIKRLIRCLLKPLKCYDLKVLLTYMKAKTQNDMGRKNLPTENYYNNG